MMMNWGGMKYKAIPLIAIRYVYFLWPKIAVLRFLKLIEARTHQITFARRPENVPIEGGLNKEIGDINLA